MSLALAKKTCPRCSETKGLEAFNRDRDKSDGRASYCRACNRAKSREWYGANRERDNENSRRWKQKNRERASELGKLHRQRHPEKARARWTLNNAVRDGLIVKPERCQACGEPIEPRHLHGHHPDYSKPLEVEWLCYRCHDGQHRVAA